MERSASNLNAIASVPITRTGVLLKKEKGIIRSSWKERFFILYGGSLFWYITEADLTPKGILHLYGSQLLDNTRHLVKRKYAWCIHTSSGEHVFLAAKEEKGRDDWFNDIKQALTKSPSIPPDKESIKKAKSSVTNRLIETALNLGPGAKIIKDYLTDDAFVIMEAVRNFLDVYAGPEKAAKVEKQVLSLGVKVALMYRDKTITKDYFVSLAEPVRKLVDKLIDGYEIPFTFSLPDVIESINNVRQLLEKVLKPFLQEKAINKMNSLFEFFSNEEMLGDFYTKRKWKECEQLGVTLRRMWDAGFFGTVT